jgi:glutaminase
MKTALDRLVQTSRPYTRNGTLANYIPELAKANANALAICICDHTGNCTQSGDFNTPFTIQSVSKVVTLLYALESYGEDVFSRIGVEQTADAFNSIIKLETRNQGKPLNPLINAGAIATIAYIAEHEGKGTFRKLSAFLRKMAQNDAIHVNQDVYASEKRTGDINRALAYFQKGANSFSASVNIVLDTYFQMCSLEVHVKDLARIAQVLTNNGIIIETGERLFSEKTARMTKSIMTTCGMYDSSGHFAVTVGIPSKSGVGGGILSVVPGRYGIGTLGPALDEKGNSAAGVELLSQLSQELNLSIFQ